MPVIAAKGQTAPATVTRIAVPGFIAAAKTAAPVATPAAPALKAPSWPDISIVRAHLFSGDKADIELVSDGASERYRVRELSHDGRVTRIIECWTNVFGGWEPQYCYIGILRSDNDEFTTTGKSPMAMDNLKVRLFADWLHDLLVGVQTPGVAVSCAASRRAEKSAATAARQAATKVEARVSSVAALAKEAEGEPMPTPQAIHAIHACLQYLQGLDGDKARRVNNSGYSKADSFNGHYLADLAALTMEQALAGRRMVRRYQGQLPRAMVQAALDAPAE
jgi:hypothetical protein